MRCLLHFVSLGGPGGTERHLVEFVERAERSFPEWRQAVLAAGAPVHAGLAASLDGRLIGHEKRAGRVKLPAVPALVRRAALRRTLARTRPDVVMIWNRPVRSRPLLEALGTRSWLAWEHGAAWLPEAEQSKQAFYERCPRIIANSHATRRVLALKWGRGERVDVCLNALRPSIAPARLLAKAPCARPLRLGVAGRLVAVKGAALALHALALLHGRGIEAELHVAGDGARRSALESLARRLGVTSAVVWHGFLSDMGAFYRGIDCLVHPALHEAFGLVCLEAAAHGCPVVTASVDGLPEVVAHGVSGFCIAPELPLADYPALGGSLEQIPAYVYDPLADDITVPRLVSPEALADAVERLLDSGTFAALSAGAVEETRKKLDFDGHVAAVMSIVERFRGETCDAR